MTDEIPADIRAKFTHEYDQAVVRLIMRETFYAQVLFSMELVLTTEIPTLGVDGTHLFINPHFFLSLDPKLRESALIHEILHVVYEHPFRTEWRDPDLFNVACDYEVNPMIKEYGREIGETWLYDEQFDGMPAELIYKELLKEAEQRPRSGGKNGEGQMRQGWGPKGKQEALDNVCKPKGDAQQVADQRAQVQANVIKAATIAKQFGSLPGNIEKWVEHIKATKQPWYEILQRWMKNLSWNDYTWKRPDPRAYMKTGAFAPRLFSEQVGRVACGIDWSGSMDDEQLKVICFHINGILEEVKPKELLVMHFDTRIRTEEVFTSQDLPVKFHSSGRGGTDFRPVFDRIKQLGEYPEVLLMFTDTFGPFPSEAPPYPVLWVTDQHGAKVPFGEVIEI